MTIAPLTYTYEGDGEFKACGPAMQVRADDHFVVGKRYRLVEHEERSRKTHNHFFACVSEAWQSMPDHLLDEYPSPEHLRAKMLIKAGYANHADFVCSNRRDIMNVRALALRNPYAVVTVKDSVVRVYEAHSQSTKAMGKETFAASKEAVLNAISDLLGTDAAGLRGAA